MSISVENLTVILDGKPVLQNLSLTLPERGIIGLSGP